MNVTSHGKTFLTGFAVLLLSQNGRGQDIPELIRQLGAPQYHTRERALRNLREEVHRPDFLDQLRGPFPDPEIDHRAGRLREQYVDQLKPAALPTLPWIDMLPGTGYPKAQDIVQDYLARSGGHGKAPLWPGDIEATQLWVRDQVGKRVPRDQILATLDAMAEVQQKSVWYKDYVKAVGK